MRRYLGKTSCGRPIREDMNSFFKIKVCNLHIHYDANFIEIKKKIYTTLDSSLQTSSVKEQLRIST